MNKLNRLLVNYIIPRLLLDIIIFFVFLTFAGIIGSRTFGFPNFVFTGIVVYSVLIFAFIFNDIVDRDDDKRSPFKNMTIREFYEASLSIRKQDGVKRFENPFSFGLLTVMQGYIWIALIAFISIILSFMVGGIFGLIVTVVTLLLGLLYSGIGRIRLKSIPVLDIVSHAFLLAGLPVLIYFSISPMQLTFGSWLIFVGATIGSLGGSFQNQYRDFEDDMAGGITNTSKFVGRKRSRTIAFIAYLVAVILVIVGIYL